MTPDQFNAFWGSVVGNFVADGLLIGVPLLLGLLIRSLRKQHVLEKFWLNRQTSPDGKKSSAVVDGDVYVGGESGISNLTHSTAREENARWSKNSRWLAFQKPHGNMWQVWVADTTTGRSVSLATVHDNKRRDIDWADDNSLVIQMGGTYWTVYPQEIEKRLR